MTAMLDAPVDWRTMPLEPVTIGPTWQINPDWDGVSDDPLDKFLLPEVTLGWEILAWITDNLLGEDGKPFRPTPEQQRFILWWYALDDYGAFLYRDGVLQRLKGWGKDPLVAVICAVEFLGPCRFVRWRTEDVKDSTKPWERKGEPVAAEHPRAWIQVAAVSKDQTKNTMTIFPGLFSEECKKRHGMNKLSIGKEIVYSHAGQRRIEAVTSSPKSLEGGRTTFTVRNETHHWLENNDGHEMAEVIDRNATKSKDGSARALSITNAYEPSQDSVAQRQREAWEAEHEGLAIDTGVLYDSLEVPAELGFIPPGVDNPSDDDIKTWIGRLIAMVRGDSYWLNVDRIVAAVLNRAIPVSRSRRFWFNQVVASEDAWLDPAAVDAAEDPATRAARARVSENTAMAILEAGWTVGPDEPIVMFFDGSKSDDATGLVGCRIEDGYCFTIGVWAKPSGEAGKGWLAPRDRVDERVDLAFERFNVVAFWGDPSHTLDDDSTRYWDRYLDAWHRRYKDKLQLWSIKTGNQAHSIMWDMASPERQKLFAAAAELTASELQQKSRYDEWDPAFYHDGHPALKAHLKNALRSVNQWGGVSIRKAGRESPKKIDLAACLIGARMLARLLLNTGVEDEEEEGGVIW